MCRRFFLKDNPNPCFINLGTGIDCNIKELASTVQEVTDFKGKLVFDTSKPDGTPRKLLDVSKMSLLGWKSKIGLEDGIQKTYAWFLKQVAQG